MAQFRTVDQGVAVSGFTGLNAALKRIEGGAGNFGVQYELQRRLRVVGEKVGRAAEAFITHKYGPSSDDPLEGSVNVSVTQTRAAVFSNSAHGGAQNSGAYPKAGKDARGPHIQARNASKWMNKGVASEREFVAAEMDGLLDWVVTEFEIDL